jgi:hypothetical protein
VRSLGSVVGHQRSVKHIPLRASSPIAMLKRRTSDLGSADPQSFPRIRRGRQIGAAARPLPGVTDDALAQPDTSGGICLPITNHSSFTVSAAEWDAAWAWARRAAWASALA